MKTIHPCDDDHPHEECGVFGIFGLPDAAAHTALGLHALQHRGQEAAGIVSFDGEHFHHHRALGLVGDNFGSEQVIGWLPGAMAIGHNRYSTTGGTVLRNVQPLFAEFEFGGLAIAHNGNLTNAYRVRKSLVRRGCIFQSTMDTEVIIHLIATSLYSTVVDRVIDALKQVEGAYSLVALTQEALIGVRDPLGIRPLVVGRLGDTFILASESCALDIIGAEFVRDVEAGEVVIIDAGGLRSIKPFGRTPARFCIFEYIYFSRPDSTVEGKNVYDVRKRIGAELARESPVDVDMVVPVPDSGVPAWPRFRRGGGAAVRVRHHPQPLRGAHLHRALGPDPPPRRQAQAQRQRGQDQGQAGCAGRRFHRPRHHVLEDRRDGPRPPAPARSTCASPARRRRTRASTASTCRRARSSWRPATTSRR